MMFCVFWLIQAIDFCGRVSGKKMVGLGLPQIYIHSCQPVGAVLMIIFVTECIIKDIRSMVKKEEQS